MTKSIPRTMAFVVVMIVYLVYPYRMISSYESVLEGGEVFRFIPMPVDPFDAFRGKFIRLNIPDNNIDKPNATEDFNNGQKVYISVGIDNLGNAFFEDIFTVRPASPGYFSTTVRRVSGNTITFQVPFDKYYLPEEFAQLAEDEYRHLTMREIEDDSLVYLDVRIKEGASVIEELYMKDQPILEYLEDIVNASE